MIPPVEQLKQSIARLKNRYRVFIAYLQPFSNTYGSLARLQSVYEPLLRVPGVAGLSLGTRPDCLEEDVYGYLGELASRTFLTVELGLQSSHDATLSLINRGHAYGDFVRAATRLAELGIENAAHVIIGLPGETPAMIFETASRLAALPITGVKIHQLMIIKGSAMEKMHDEGKVKALTIAAYAPLLCGFLERLRPDQRVHRIMADSREANGLLAPLWSADKNGSLAFIRKYMDENGVRQGRLYT
jgi:uncharacterized protein